MVMTVAKIRRIRTYMKFLFPASPILLAAALFLAGCDSINLPDLSRHDEVPDAVKAQPSLLETLPPPSDTAAWPLVGEVPKRPEDFSPKPIYNHYMNEMEYDRAVADDAKKQIEDEPGAPSNGSAEPDAPLQPKR
jgi:hypothetical protein